MDLAAVHVELVDEVRLKLSYVGDLPAAELARVFDELAEMLQCLGICHLLEYADSDAFRRNLVWSGYGRRFFLARVTAVGTPRDRHLALSRTPSFFDSLAAGALDLARDIARLSVAPWNADWEYEDDYLYFFFWHQAVLDQRWIHGQQAHDVLARFGAVIEDIPSPRFDVTASLHGGDRDAFVAALHAFLEEEQRKLERERKSAAVVEGEPCYWPRSYVCVEALALLKLAEYLGLQIPEQFALCPALGRLPWRDAHEIDLFTELERNPS